LRSLPSKSMGESTVDVAQPSTHYVICGLPESFSFQSPAGRRKLETENYAFNQPG
jgi:hypothetical protein